MARKPDPVVREESARRSVAKLTAGLVADAKAAGVLPPMRVIENYAQEVTRETINRHEDQFRNGVPDAKPVTPPSASPAKLDQGPYEDEFGTVTKVSRTVDAARLREVRGAPPTMQQVAEQYEAACFAARVQMLLSYTVENGKHQPVYPQWEQRIHDSWAKTTAMARVAGMSTHEQNNAATDALLSLLDESDTTFGREFGPWRHPKSRPIAATPGA